MRHWRKQGRKKKGLRLSSLLMGIMLLGLLAGCGTGTGNTLQPEHTPSTPSPFQTITITAIDYSYVMPTSFALQAGLVDLRLINNGTQPHQAQFARLNPGVTNAQVVNELINQRQEARVFSLLTFMGGPDTVSPGDGQETILDLPVGDYVLLCLVTGADGLPHIDKGMIHFLTVSPGPQALPVPQASGDLIINDQVYLLPAVLTQPVISTVRVENQGTEPHEVNIVRLTSGKSAQDVLAFFRHPSGPPPFEEFGGMATLAPGTAGWMTVHLEAGNYAVLSVIPDPKTGAFQLTQGLLTPFSVQ